MLVLLAVGVFAQEDSRGMELVGKGYGWGFDQVTNIDLDFSSVRRGGRLAYNFGRQLFILEIEEYTCDIHITEGVWTRGNISDLASDGEYIFVASTYAAAGFAIYYQHVHGQPPEVRRYMHTNGSARHLEIIGDTVFVATDSGFIVIDITDVPVIAEISRYTSEYPANATSVNDTILYLGTSAGLSVINISDLTSPFRIGFYPTEEPIWDVEAYDDFVRCANNTRGVLSLNVSDPASPMFLRYSGGGGKMVSILDASEGYTGFPGEYLFLDIVNGYWDTMTFPGTGHGLEGIGARDGYGNFITTPFGIYSWYGCGFWDSWGVIVGPFLTDIELAPYEGIGHLDVSSSRAVLNRNVIFDVSDIEHPLALSKLDHYGNGFGSFFVGDTIYTMRDYTDFIFKYLITDITNPRIVDNIPYALAPPIGVSKVDHYLVGQSSGSLTIYDMASESLMFESETSLEYTQDIYIIDNLLYFSTLDSFKIYDISDPGSPLRISSVSLWSAFGMTCTDGNYACVYSNFMIGFIKVIDVSNPYEPVLLDSFPASSTIEDIENIGPYLYVVGERGFRLYDTSDPSDVVLVDSVYIEGANSLELQGNYAYVGTQSCELYVFDISSNVIEHQPGWNLLSSPIESPMPVADLFSHYVDPCYAYVPDSAYYPVDTLFPGLGFWLLGTEPDQIDCYDYALADSVFWQLTPGWNIVGGPDHAVPKSSLEMGDAVDPAFYMFITDRGNYLDCDVLSPGVGYFIFAYDTLDVWVR